MAEWQLIDTAPKDGTHILLVDADDTPLADREVCMGWWAFNEWRDYGNIGCNGQYEYAPTHWMPAPQPPTIGVYPSLVEKIMSNHTCYVERSKVREIIMGVADEHVHVTEGILADVDQLPITTALIPTPRRLVDVIGANRPWLSFAQCMEIAQDVHKSAHTRPMEAGDQT